MVGTMVKYTGKERTLPKQMYNAHLNNPSVVYPHPTRISLLQPIYVHYILRIYDTKELLNLKWKLQVVNTWMSMSKPYYISWNAANLADNRNIGTIMYIIFIISKINSVKIRQWKYAYISCVCVFYWNLESDNYIHPLGIVRSHWGKHMIYPALGEFGWIHHINSQNVII